jgi:hypothetical protein
MFKRSGVSAGLAKTRPVQTSVQTSNRTAELAETVHRTSTEGFGTSMSAPPEECTL